MIAAQRDTGCLDAHVCPSRARGGRPNQASSPAGGGVSEASSSG